MQNPIQLQTFHLVSLGCPKNCVDSEVVLGVMTQSGYQFCGKSQEANIIIVNTCSFIQTATEESISTILELTQMKKKGKCGLFIVMGCLPQRYKGQLMKELPEVDLFLGTSDFERIDKVIGDFEKGRKYSPSFDTPDFLYDDTTPRINSGPSYTSYIKIAEGCSSACTFCIIPKLRGPHRSRKPESIIREVKNLVDRGVKEVNLVAQETTAYGSDLSGEVNLVDLLKGLVSINKLHWIRLLYGYPYNLPPGLLELIKEQKKLCNYLDLPIQHINDRILENMGRRGGVPEIRSLIEKIKSGFPEIALRTTVIVGFPGETEKAFTELLDYIKNVEFDHLGVFGFSPEQGTPAAGLPGRVPEDVIQDRLYEIMRVQADIAKKRNNRFNGKTLPVLIEGHSKETELLLQGRTEFQAPEIDGHVLINKGIANVGDLVNVRITQTLDYDLVGEILP